VVAEKKSNYAQSIELLDLFVEYAKQNKRLGFVANDDWLINRAEKFLATPCVNRMLKMGQNNEQ